MRLELTGRHVAITPSLRTLAEDRVKRVLRLLNDHALSAQLVLTRQRAGIHAEATLHARGEHFLHAEAAAGDAQAALGLAIDKVDRQARTLKGKWEGKKRAARWARAAGDTAPAPGPRPTSAPPVRIVRTRGYRVRPMAVQAAALAVRQTPGAFLVFRNAVTAALSVAFRRADGQVGLIEVDG